jgi:hypothetical protein
MNNPTYNIYKVLKDDKTELITAHAFVGNTYEKNVEFDLEEFEEYDELYINGRTMGFITNINENIFTISKEQIDGKNKNFKYKIEQNSPLHLSFMIS